MESEGREVDQYGRDPRLKNFKNFLWLVWKHLQLPEPTKAQYAIADFLQHGPDRLIVEAFRGIGKSWITSAFALWFLYWNPQANVLVVSASLDRARDWTYFTLKLILEVPELAWLKPDEVTKDRRSVLSFDVGPARASHAPSVKAQGITGQITGTRADLIVFDDVEIPSNSDTQIKREMLAKRLVEFDAILKPLKTSRMVGLGTPQTEDTIYKLLPERGFFTYVWPARMPERPLWGNYDTVVRTIEESDEGSPKLSEVKWQGLAQELRESLLRDGEPTDPERFDEYTLLEKEAGMGRQEWLLQFQLDTNLSDEDRYPLKLRDFIVLDCDDAKAPENLVWGRSDDIEIKDLPCVGLRGDRWYRPREIIGSWLPYHGKLMAIDPSGRGDNETSYVVIGNLNGYLYVLDWGGVEGYDEESLHKLATVAQRYKVNDIVTESNFGDGMFESVFWPVLKKYHPCNIEEVRHSVQKERRICDTLEPVLRNHRLIIDRGVIERDMEARPQSPPERRPLYRGAYQLSRMTREKGCLKYDDRADVLAIGVSWWTERISVDADDAVKRRQDELLQKELDKLWEIDEPKVPTAFGVYKWLD